MVRSSVFLSEPFLLHLNYLKGLVYQNKAGDCYFVHQLTEGIRQQPFTAIVMVLRQHSLLHWFVAAVSLINATFQTTDLCFRDQEEKLVVDLAMSLGQKPIAKVVTFNLIERFYLL